MVEVAIGSCRPSRCTSSCTCCRSTSYAAVVVELVQLQVLVQHWNCRVVLLKVHFVATLLVSISVLGRFRLCSMIVAGCRTSKFVPWLLASIGFCPIVFCCRWSLVPIGCFASEISFSVSKDLNSLFQVLSSHASCGSAVFL